MTQDDTYTKITMTLFIEVTQLDFGYASNLSQVPLFTTNYINTTTNYTCYLQAEPYKFIARLPGTSINLGWASIHVLFFLLAQEFVQNTPQPLYNTIIGVHSINRVS